MDALLGQDEDRVTANRLYREFPSMRWISTKLVQERRKALGIEGCGRNRSKTTGSKRRQPTVVTPPWTPEEDAILGTDSLAKVSVRLSRPTSQIQKRMKELGIAHFGQRGTPRSSVRLQAEEAQKERNKIKYSDFKNGGPVTGVINDDFISLLADCGSIDNYAKRRLAEKQREKCGALRWSYLFEIREDLLLLKEKDKSLIGKGAAKLQQYNQQDKC